MEWILSSGLPQGGFPIRTAPRQASAEAPIQMSRCLPDVGSHGLHTGALDRLHREGAQAGQGWRYGAALVGTRCVSSSNQ